MDKVVLITGGSSGIGEACVRLYAKRGYDVIFTYLKNTNRALHLSQKLQEKYGVHIFAYQVDVCQDEDIKRLKAEITKDYDKIDVIVNYAGIARDSLFCDKTEKDFMEVLNTNLIGPFRIVKCLADLVRGGTIVNVGSTNGIDSNYSYSMDYDASKAGLHILTKDLAVALGPDIRVNAVAPGSVATEMVKEFVTDQMVEYMKQMTPLGKMAEPYEMAGAYVYLASEDSSYTTGATLNIDGGIVM